MPQAGFDGMGAGDVRGNWAGIGDVNTVKVITTNPGAGYIDAVLINTPIEIRVYP
jgi:hypothetical protein